MSLNDQLDRLRDMLNSIHEMLAVQAAVISHLADAEDGGGLSRAELNALRRRLTAHARKLEGIVSDDRPNPVTTEANMAGALDDVLKRIDDDTTALAGVVTKLRDKIKTSMTQADVDAAKATLSAVADRLEATAADPANPVPQGEPVRMVQPKK